MIKTCVVALGAVVASVALATPTLAGGKAKSVVAVDDGGAHPRSSYYRKAPQVRGFIQRRGGYSYSYADTINTYGQSRTLYGSNNSYRDWLADRQTNSGPFDHGFFWDTGLGGFAGGNSTWRN
jgi:hypothetical protein